MSVTVTVPAAGACAGAAAGGAVWADAVPARAAVKAIAATAEPRLFAAPATGQRVCPKSTTLFPAFAQCLVLERPA